MSSYTYIKQILIKILLNMAEFRISGIWKDDEGVITHYSVHKITEEGNVLYIEKGEKINKAKAVALLLQSDNTVKTALWNYGKAKWSTGSDIHVVKGNPSFLRTNHDGTERDNLGHLIDYGYVF